MLIFAFVRPGNLCAAKQKHYTIKKNMKKVLAKQMALWAVVLFSTLSLLSCDEDWWDSRRDVSGYWRVVEVTGWANCPYQQGDRWVLYGNGDFESYGSGNFHETGYWRLSGRTLQFTFPPKDYYISMDAYISTYDNDYMTLRVNDYDNNTNYTLRLIRYSY